jgi:outer membrane protein
MGRLRACRLARKSLVPALLIGVFSCQGAALVGEYRNVAPVQPSAASGKNSTAAHGSEQGGSIQLAEHVEPQGTARNVPKVEPAASELTLLEVIQLARTANPDLRAANERLQLADALLARARAEFYPRLGVGEDYGVTNNPVNVFSFLLNQGQLSLTRDFNHPPTLGNFHTQALVQQGLYTGGRRLAQARSAEAQREASGFALAAVQNELVFRVAEAYYRLLQARDLVAVREAAVKQVQQHLEIVKVREKAGTAVKSDVLTVEVRLAEVQEALITARNQVELAWAVLENVTGTAIARRPLPKEMPPAPWTEHIGQVEAAVAEALQRRPEVGELANRRQAAQHDIRAAEAGKYPTVDLVGDYDVFTAGDFGKSKDSFFVGVVARLTLFDGGRTRSEVRQAEARFRELLAREQRLARDIELAVRQAYLQLSDARQRLQVATQAVTQAEESLREIEVRYKGQTATITQLIDAQVALSNARVRRTGAQAEVAVASAALEQAIGRLTNLTSR